MSKRAPKKRSVIIACRQELSKLEDLRKSLTAAGVSFTVRDESITDDDPTTGYPRAYDIFWIETDPSQTSIASKIAQSQQMPLPGKPICPKCLSTSIELEGFIRWFLPMFLTRCWNGHPNLPGRKRRCRECNYTWARFNRPSM